MSEETYFYEWEIMVFFYFLFREYQKGRINLQQVKTILPKMFFKDQKDEVWTLGIKTGKWYKRHKNKWILGIPYGKLTQYKNGDQ